MATQGAPLFYLGSVVSPLDGMNMGQPLPPPPTYNASFDADRLRKATKVRPGHRLLSRITDCVPIDCLVSQGFGTDERTIIDTLSPLGAVEMTAVARTFEAQVGKSLVKVLEKETKGYFEYALRGLAMGPLEWDAWLIHRACAGAGTHEEYVSGRHPLIPIAVFGR
jgi:annexin A7/11